MHEAGVDILVRRSDLRRTRIETGPAPDAVELAAGDALLSVDAFAFTANNITYAVMGDALSYWRFFPAADPWGRIPAWGFATVVRSLAPGVAEGARFYGFYPMSTHIVVTPVRVGPGGFVDGATHRQGLPELYNLYRPARPEASPADEAEEMLFKPTFATSFLLDHFLADNHLSGVSTVILSSASAKTAYGLAALLGKRAGCEVWGLTSPRNQDFVKGLGFYHRVLTYADAGALPADAPSLFVDFAGDGNVRRAVHGRAGGLRASITVGETHWEAGRPAAVEPLPGPEPVFFFAPTELARRAKSWGPGGLRERLDEAWQWFVPGVRSWLRIVRAHGPEAVTRVYLETLENRAAAEVGQILSVHG